jgi:hypothetical protein
MCMQLVINLIITTDGYFLSFLFKSRILILHVPNRMLAVIVLYNQTTPCTCVVPRVVCHVGRYVGI